MYPIKLDLLHYPQRIFNNFGMIPRNI